MLKLRGAIEVETTCSIVMIVGYDPTVTNEQDVLPGTFGNVAVDVE